MQDASEDACRFRPERPPLLLELDQRSGRADSSRSVKQLAVVAKQRPEFSLADANGILQHGLKHRLKLAWRTADHLENLGRRGLLLQGLGQIIGALAQLVEQPCVLDGDNSLRGKIRHQFDLLVGEWPDFLAVNANSTDKLLLPKHRDDEKSASASEVGQGENHWVAFEVRPPGPNILNVRDLPCPFDVAETALRMGTEWRGPRFNVSGRCVVEGNSAEIASVVQI